MAEAHVASAWIKFSFEWNYAGTEEGFEHDPYLAYLKVEPALDHLRSDPRFADLVRRVRLGP